jgi:hypothetical protein
MNLNIFSTWRRNLLGLIVLFGAALCASGQDYSKWSTLQVTAAVESNPPRITLSWPAREADFTKYNLQRKASGTSTVYATLAKASTGYVDTNVVAGVAYEYKITANAVDTTNFPMAYGTITSGINLAASHFTGGLLMVVASDVHASLTSDLTTYRNNLRGEGWSVSQITVNPEDSVTSVKAAILAQVTASSVPMKAVVLVGHVPVPYSGNLNPDAHPEHRGAWPCDGYYGDLQSDVWTDVNVDTRLNTVQPANARNSNIPGDGKFDQSTFPGIVELAVGRIDFHDLPSFTGKTHVQLLKGYFSKNHQYRNGLTSVIRRAVVDDNLAMLREGPSGALRRAATGIFGPTGVVDGDFLSHGVASMFGGGFGYGQYNAVDGVGSTASIATNGVKSVFNVLFGSYFGDWDTSDNPLRATIAATGNSLAAIWSSRPVCHFHNMAVGKTIGDSVQAMMNQTSDSYLQVGYNSRAVSTALMGDPTLNLNPVSPARSLLGILAGSTATLSWAHSLDTSARNYFVYRLNPGEVIPVLLTPTPIASTNFIDVNAVAGTRYAVSSTKLVYTSATCWIRSVAVDTGLTVSADPVAAWKSMMFGSSANNVNIAGDGADPDKDGCPNLLEYALGSDPLNSTSKGGMYNTFITGIGADRMLSADFRVCTANSGVNVTYQCSNSLGGWVTVSTPTVVSSTTTHTVYRVSVSAAGSKCFLRALVSRK